MSRRAQPLPHGRGSVKCARRAARMSKRLGLNAQDISARLLSGADALGGALWARRPPDRLFVKRGDLILREKSGTGASRADLGVRPTQLMQSPRTGTYGGGCIPPGDMATIIGITNAPHEVPSGSGSDVRSEPRP